MWHVWRRGAYRILEGKPEGRRPLGRPRRRWEDNIKMDLQEVGWGKWTGSIWLRIGTGGELLWMAVMNIRVPYNAGNFLSSLGRFSFPGRTLLHGVSKFENQSRKLKFHQNLTRIPGTLHEGKCKFMIISRWNRRRMTTVSDTSCR
jgi:hypothetical protein